MFIKHTESPPGPILHKFFCPRCGWTMDAAGVGIKPECPDCKYSLHILDGTKEEIDNKVASINIYMEDIQTIALDVMKYIEAKLKEKGITVLESEEDRFYVPIMEALEDYSNGNYRSQN